MKDHASSYLGKVLMHGATVGMAALLVAGAGGDLSSASVAEDDFADPISISLESGRLWVTIREEAALTEVLGEISQAAGVTLYVYGELGTTAPQRFKDLPLGEGIQRLAGRHGLVLDYRGERHRGTDQGAPILRAVHVYPYGSAGKPAPLVVEPPPDPLAASTTPVDRAISRAVAQRRVVQLSYRRDAAAVEELLRLLSPDKDARTRRDAANALASVGGPQALEALRRTGLADKDPQVRVQAAQGLWRALGMAARATITLALAREQDPAAREELKGILAGHVPDVTRDQASRFRAPR